MIINLGKDDKFAQELAKTMDLAIASEVTPEQAREESVIVADLGGEIRKEHREVIGAGMKNHASVVFRNTKSEAMAEFALFGVDGVTAVLKARDAGRAQDIIIFGEQDGPMAEPEADMIESGVSLSLAHAMASGQRPEPEKPEAVQREPLEEIVEEQLSESHMVARAIEGLSFRTSLTRDEHVQVSNINASQASGTVIFAQKTWHPAKNPRGTNTIFGAFDIELAAVVEPVRSKIIKITSRGTAVGVTKMAADGIQNRAYFTAHGLVMLYPGGSYTWDINSITLPNGWTRRAISPETPNNTSTYTKTTGWSIGGKVGGKVAKTPEMTAELSASYSESNSISTEIADFRVKNESNAAVSKWRYEYSKLADNWKSLFYQPFFKQGRVENVVLLSKSTMFLQNESVYQTPADAVGSQRFIFYIGQGTAQLYESAHSIWKYSNHVRYQSNGMWQFMDLNLGMVRHP